MPRLHRFVSTSILAVAAIVAGGGAAAPTTRSGDAVLRAIRRAFDGTETTTPMGCLTPLVMRAYHDRAWLSPEANDELQALLGHKLLGASTYVSPLGYFSLHYVTTGPDSVPAADEYPADGVPDFIQHCADYADRAWVTEIDSLGYTAPELPPDGTYDITFVALAGGTYGYTQVVGATTDIHLHHTFQGFGFPGPNDDPDGTQLGRAKVTIAHEFKHASQFTTSGWTEVPCWPELDAMGIEDVVFPLVNEYRYWVGDQSLSQLDAPWVSLDAPGTTGAEDCLWHHYLEGTWGSALLRDYWTRRGQVPSEPAQDSYMQALATRGTGWKESYAKYLEWCWFTGARAESSFGFPDALELWRMELPQPAVATYPWWTEHEVPHLSSYPYRCNRGTASGYPRVIFDGGDSCSALVLSVILKYADGSFRIEEPELDAENDCNYVVEDPWPTLQYCAILVTNGEPWSGSQYYALEVQDDTGVGVGAPEASAPGPRFDASPNPSRGAVAFSFQLPREGSARLRILDVRGRTVRALALRARRAGAGSVAWDTRDERGSPLPAGVYWAELEAGGTRLVRRITLLR